MQIIPMPRKGTVQEWLVRTGQIVLNGEHVALVRANGLTEEVIHEGPSGRVTGLDHPGYQGSRQEGSHLIRIESDPQGVEAEIAKRKLIRAKNARRR